MRLIEPCKSALSGLNKTGASSRARCYRGLCHSRCCAGRTGRWESWWQGPKFRAVTIVVPQYPPRLLRHRGSIPPHRQHTVILQTPGCACSSFPFLAPFSHSSHRRNPQDQAASLPVKQQFVDRTCQNRWCVLKNTFYFPFHGNAHL